MMLTLFIRYIVHIYCIYCMYNENARAMSSYMAATLAASTISVSCLPISTSSTVAIRYVQYILFSLATTCVQQLAYCAPLAVSRHLVCVIRGLRHPRCRGDAVTAATVRSVLFRLLMCL
jgi:hypothetical protein